MLLLQSCSHEPGVWRNDEIQNGLRKDLHKLNDELLTALKAGDPKQMDEMLSAELLESGQLYREAHLLSLRMKNDTYKLLADFYIVHEKRGLNQVDGNIDGNKFTLSYDALMQDMYIAMFVPQKAVEKMMITAVYYKYNYGWKLFLLNEGRYTENNQTAPQLLKRALSQYNKHQLVDAVLTTNMAHDCLRPNEMWHYPIDDHTHATLGKAISEANQAYKFPFTLTQAPTHPRIIHISNKITSEGTFPVIYYLSTVKVSDTTALKRENEMIQQVIGQAIPGIDQDKKYVYYTAYNEMPNYHKAVDSFEMIERVK